MNFFKEALVVDPVMVSTSGDVLAGPSVLAAFRYVTSRIRDPLHSLHLKLLCLHFFEHVKNCIFLAGCSSNLKQQTK